MMQLPMSQQALHRHKPKANDRPYNLMISGQEEGQLNQAAHKALVTFKNAYLGYLAYYSELSQAVHYEVVFLDKGSLPVEFQPYVLGGLNNIKPMRRRDYDAPGLWELAQYHARWLEDLYLGVLLQLTKGHIEAQGGYLAGPMPISQIASHDIILMPVSVSQIISEQLPFPLHPHLKADNIAARFCLQGEHVIKMEAVKETKEDLEHEGVPECAEKRSGCMAQKQTDRENLER